MNGYQLSADPRHRQGGREIAAEEKPPMGPPDTGREDPEVEEQLCEWAPSGPTQGTNKGRGTEC